MDDLSKVFQCSRLYDVEQLLLVVNSLFVRNPLSQFSIDIISVCKL